VTDKNINDFKSNEVLSCDLANKIRNVYQRQMNPQGNEDDSGRD
jgi:hypothetical protein